MSVHPSYTHRQWRNTTNTLHHLYYQPKCTPGIAGHGIEFDWAMAKLWFRMQRVEKRKKKQDFVQLVDTALSDKVVSLERSRKFSRRRRRENMYAYYITS